MPAPLTLYVLHTASALTMPTFHPTEVASAEGAASMNWTGSS